MFVDRRFPTNNTNLAACLAALRIPIKTQDPVYVVEESEPPNGEKPKHTVTFFFDMQSYPNDDQTPIEQSEHVDWAWQHREQFERENPEHPLVYMRRALDKLQFLLRIKKGALKDEHGNPRAWEPGDARGEDWQSNFETTDIFFAAVVMGSGKALHSYLNGTFYFTMSEHERERIIEEYDCFRHGKDPICYMRRVIECRRELIKLVKRAPVLMHYLNGDPMEGGKEGYIAKGISPEKLNRFFEFLYE